MKIKKILFGITFSLALMLGLMLGMSLRASAEEGHTHDNITFQKWESNNSLPTNPGNYYLTENVTISSTWSVPGRTSLCLNGKSITMTGQDSVIKVSDNATLNLYDCGNGSITGGEPYFYGGGVCVENATFNMYSGTITGNTARDGGGVYVDNATFNMHGGTISDNTETGTLGGGGVGVITQKGKATFNMYSGEITKNQALYGGGVSVFSCDEDATFNMYGGSITDNKAKRDSNDGGVGGGVKVDRLKFNAAFNMYGGTVTGNTAEEYGGGVEVNDTSGAVFRIRGGSVITGNHKKTGTETIADNVCLTDYAKIIIAGKLTSNEKIGVTMNGREGVFTDSKVTTYNDVNKFKSENDQYRVIKNADGQLALVKDIDVESIVLKKESTLTVGDTEMLTATVKPDDAADKAVTWSSDKPGVAAVDDKGKITAVSAGTAKITATATNGTDDTKDDKTATCTVTVKPVIYTVTYKVVGGTWSDGSMANKTESVQSGSKPANVPTGMKASDGYNGGAWDKNPAETTITGATTFTYSFAKKQPAETSTQPTADTPETPNQPTADTPTTPAQPKSAKLRLNSGLKLTQKGSAIQAKWGMVNEADGYEVYGAYCGNKHKLLATIDNGQTTKVTITKLNGKKINRKKICKMYVVAYNNVDGKRTRLAESLHLHLVGKENKKFTNVKSIKLKKKSYTLQKGRTAKIKAKLVLADNKKKPLSNKHGKKFRYASSNEKVATVTKGGKIKAKNTGSCTVYVYAINGCTKKIRVVVIVK